MYTVTASSFLNTSKRIKQNQLLKGVSLKKSAPSQLLPHTPLSSCAWWGPVCSSHWRWKCEAQDRALRPLNSPSTCTWQLSPPKILPAALPEGSSGPIDFIKAFKTAQGQVLEKLWPFFSQCWSSYSSQQGQDLSTVLQNVFSILDHLFLYILMFLQQGARVGAPFHGLAGVGIVEDAVWVRLVFSCFVQPRNIFIRLPGWLPCSLFPVLELKQQRDESELPAWKMEMSSKF